MASTWQKQVLRLKTKEQAWGIFEYSCLDSALAGYLFCAEMMEPNHEMRLMLVNTLRKVSPAQDVFFIANIYCRTWNIAQFLAYVLP